jgi:hypothetical protein
MRGGSEPMTLSEITLRSVGRKWVYIFDRRKAKKLIPVIMMCSIMAVLAAEN